uniref:Uncharacterized protein n=1 Tax=Fagus sylvatica TaxID=28930 RepID=A0A2N9HTB2_FAGSY
MAIGPLPSWWILNKGISLGLETAALGLRLGGYGVVVTGLVVTAWAWWLRRGGSARETHGSKIFFFLFSAAPPETTSHHQERPTDVVSQIWTHRGQPPPRRGETTAWLSAQICNHRGHAVKHGPRWFLVVLSSDFRWFFVVQISTASSDDPNGLEAPPRWFLVVGCSDLHGGFWLFRFPVVFGSDLHGSS